MKKLISWLCIIAILLLLLFYVVSAGANEQEAAANAGNTHAALAQARDLIMNTEDGLEVLVRNGASLILKGPAWEPLARKKLREAAQKAVLIEGLLAPFLPPQGVGALRYMNLGVGDRVVQKTEYMPYSLDFTSRISPSVLPAQGEVIGGPTPENGRLFWLIRFSAEKEGWLPEDVLTKEFPHNPLLIAAACWMHGNTLTYRMVATLRIYQNDELTGERNAAIKDMLASIIAAYECALGMYSLPQTIVSVGKEEAARYREIIKKNFPIMQEQQKQSQRKSSDGRVGSQEENEMIRAIFGDERTREKKSKQIIVVPIPQREGDPERKFTPGVPIGVQ